MAYNELVFKDKKLDGEQIFELTKVRIAWWMNGKWHDLNIFTSDMI